MMDDDEDANASQPMFGKDCHLFGYVIRDAK